jgi:hypothetical protein
MFDFSFGRISRAALRGRARRVLLHTLTGAFFGVSFLATSCGSGGGASPGGCNTLVDDASEITSTVLADNAGAPTGGRIADGTYALSAFTVHTESGGPTQATAERIGALFQIQGKTMQQVGTANGVEKRYTSTFVTSGSTITTTDSCPMPKTETHSFTATGTELRLYDTVPDGTVEQIYSRR